MLQPVRYLRFVLRSVHAGYPITTPPAPSGWWSELGHFDPLYSMADTWSAELTPKRPMFVELGSKLVWASPHRGTHGAVVLGENRTFLLQCSIVRWPALWCGMTDAPDADPDTPPSEAEAPQRRPVGRPRVHEEGSGPTASERARALEARRRAVGQRRLCIWLTAEEQRALQVLAERIGNVRSAVGVALMDAAGPNASKLG